MFIRSPALLESLRDSVSTDDLSVGSWRKVGPLGGDGCGLIQRQMCQQVNFSFSFLISKTLSVRVPIINKVYSAPVLARDFESSECL